MKERFNIEIADIKFSILSDDGEEFVRQSVAAVDERIRGIFGDGKNYSKMDAAILAALDFCAEKQTADRKIKSLEAQVEILEANLHRLREDAAEAGASAAKEAVEESFAPDTEVETEADNSGDEIEETASSEAEASDEVKASEEATPVAEENAKSDNSSRGAKLREIEALLGGQLKMDLGKAD